MTGAAGTFNFDTAALCSGFGQWHSPNNKRDPRQYVTTNMAGIKAMMSDPTGIEKARAQWVIFSTLLSRVHIEQRQNGQFYALWADIDEAKGMTFDEIVDRANGCLLDFWAYTSRSATKKKQKARIIVPLVQPVDGHHFVLLQKILNDKLEKNGIMPDRATERAGQVCYLPNRGEFYRWHVENSTGPMSPDAWTDEIRGEQERIKAAEKAVQERREQARIKATRRMKTGCQSPIDAYNAEFGLEMELESRGYVQRGRRYLSPNSVSGVPGVSITDDGKKWLSTHSSDAGIGTPTGNGTMGDAFDLFVHYEHGGDRNRAIKAAGEMFGLNRAPATMPEEPPPWVTEEIPPPIDEQPPETHKFSNGTNNKRSDAFTSGEKKKSGGWDKLCNLITQEEYIAMLGKEEWYYRNLILKNQITILVAKSGGGKSTILFNYVCPMILREHPEVEITYFDLDSPLSDHKTMFSRADSYGKKFQWIVPQHSGKDDAFIIEQLKNVVKERYPLENKILVFDTLKKFCYLIGKDSVRAFFKLLRQLNALGATIVLPAHANKYRQEGLLIPEGVGDVTNDTDNLIIIERVPAEGGQYASTIVDPDKHAKVRGIFEPISFFIEKGTRETTALKEYVQPPDFTFNPQSSSKISDDEIAAGIRNHLIGQSGHIPQKDLLSALQKMGFPYNRLRNVLDSLAIPEKEASHHGQIFFSTGFKNSKRYAIYGR